MTYFPSADARAQATGMYIEPYGQSWPDLAPILTKIYQERMAQLPFLPPNWLGLVMLEHGVDGNILIPIRPRNALGLRSTAAPGWLDTQQKEDAWSGPAKTAVDAINQYAAGKASEGRVQLERLYADSDYWSTLLSLAQTVGTPVTMFSDGVKKLGEGASDFGQQIATGAMYLGIAGVIGIVAFKALGPKRRRSR